MPKEEGARRRIGVVVLNYENAEDTAACLESLRELRHPDTDVVVVDNGSSAACVKAVERAVRATPRARLVRSEWNRGYAAGNNIGIRAALDAGAEYVLVLNNDTLVPPGFLDPLVAALEKDPSAVIAMPHLLDEAGRDTTPLRSRPTLRGYYYRRFGLIPFVLGRMGRPVMVEPSAPPRPHPPVEVEVAVGACMLLRASFLREIGLLDEGTFLYEEEFILSEQVRRAGRRTLLVGDSHVTHLGGRSTRKMRVRRSVEMWKSQNYYLRAYRGVGAGARSLLIAYQAASFALLWTGEAFARGLRRPGRTGAER